MVELEARIARLETILFNQTQNARWVKPAIAAQFLGVSARQLVRLYDQGELHKACAKQINSSTQRRRLLFDINLVRESIGGRVLS